MKISVVFVFLATLCLSITSAQPVQSPVQQGFSLLVKEEPEVFEQELPDVGEESQEEVVVSRSKRATCDLLSFNTKFGSLNHSACAAHCLAMRKGYRGGRCRDGICHCRR